MYNFNVEASTWDSEYRVEKSKEIAKKIYDTAKVKKDCFAMEYGCGTGLISFNLADKFKNIILMDSAQGMIDILNKKIKLSGNKNMKPVMKDLMEENYDENKFDLIYSSMSLHHVIDTEKILKTFYNLLNDSGIVCIVDLDKEDGSFHSNDPKYDGHNGFDQEYIVNVFRKVGFVNIKIETFTTYYNYNVSETVSYPIFCISGEKAYEK